MFKQGYALLVGVGTYDSTPAEYTPINVPQTAVDAQEFADVLIDPQYCGYDQNQVRVLRKAWATKATILGWLDNLAAKLEATGAPDKSTILIFYSGHGGLGSDDTYHLTTYETRLVKPPGWKQGDSWRVKEGTGISQRELLDRIAKLQSERVLLIINACHSGSVGPTLELQPGRSKEGSGEQVQEFGVSVPNSTAQLVLGSGKGRWVITACHENQLSRVGTNNPNECTIFGRAVVQGMRGEGIDTLSGYISAYDLYLKVHDQVSTTVQKQYGTAQEPELSIVKGVGRFPVALHKGAAKPNESLGMDPLPPNAPVTQYSPESVAEQYKTFISKPQQVFGDVQTEGDNNKIVQMDARWSQGAIGNVEGSVEQRTINTQGGSYTENRGK